MAPSPYYYVSQGCGGMFSFSTGSNSAADKDAPVRPLIGTRGCNSCVGVYFVVDDQRCFCAHIHAFFRSEKWPSISVRPEKHDHFVRRIKDVLTQESMDQNWPHDRERMRETLVMVCEHPGSKFDLEGELPRTGAVIMGAIAEWLCAESYEPLKNMHGFVVEYPSRVLHWFRDTFEKKAMVFPSPWKRPDTEDGWRVVDVHDGEWSFSPDGSRAKSFPFQYDTCHYGN